MTESRFGELSQWLEWMETLHSSEIDLSLGRVSKVAKKLKLTRFNSKVISVAGTNGKGSFVKGLTSLLLLDGASIGAYTSPHILSYNERIQINGIPVTDEQICEAFSVIDHARGNETLTYFEFGTLAALYLFKLVDVDYIILEVGLGGRLDAVNIIDADISVITSIALDHEAWLGSDRELIGREKAGIIRAGSPFICVDEQPPESVIHHAESLMCNSYYRGHDISLEEKGASLNISYRTRKGESASFSLSEYHLPAPSILAAVQAYSLLSNELDLDAVVTTLESIKLAGRYEQLMINEQKYIFDVAHNPQAAELLAKNLNSHESAPVIAVFAAMQDKNVEQIVASLRSNIAHWVCTEIPDLPRAYDSGELYDCLQACNVSVEQAKTPKQAIAQANLWASLQSQAATICIVGSFYLVSEIKKSLQTQS